MNYFGLVIRADKRMYVGEVKNDRLNGKGKLCSAGGITY